jgi:tRNA A58 N-methylase Trm61
MFSKDQQEKLKLAAHNGEKAVDKVIAGIKKESPELFHDETSLLDRVFYDQPDPQQRIPHAGYLRPFPPVLKVA